MTNDELRGLSDKELVHYELGCERSLTNAVLRLRVQTLENTNQVRVLRRSIARARTEQRQRELAQGLPKSTLLHTHRQDFRPEAALQSGGASSGDFLSGVAAQMQAAED